ncbi:response regulator receiver domain-containing protein [Roseivirga pacifica]|jgi:DNA-binding NtrC family response regulator|uniref:Response regulator receiver domain-containing protein n=1 Tax=Roseivirga pacifica TaxID=1267423 RepID=A0A1I0Q7D0_9BACT|nr:response regulator [Roseivirga pacifica]MCO6360601.1 response regulator [Roseivirga pacifica]MCO6368490.1 response regulator [Roseivirga pacifica]MCO6372632.1 response regulator [Roseivirga pacifica]MCO6376690.1 response regulator [Roseivirga pacifica]MCO6378030.1 response regulator [Roseivirga pacifica]
MIKVLIVDDDFGVRDTLKDFLEFFYEDIDVQLAKNGSEATALVNNESFQILISDQMMPDMKGSEFINNTIEKLREDQTWIYIYSGQLMDELSVNLKEYKEVQIIDKFTNPMFFKEIIDKYKVAHPEL